MVEQLSTTDIGELLDCPAPTVKWAIRKHGFPARTIAEARKLLFDRRGRKEVTQAELIAAYGGKCACCGESIPEFLTLDHVDGDGAKHRQEVRLRTNGKGNVALRIRQELKAAGWPKDKYRLLCMNCNFATRHGKPCPHQLKKKEV